VTKSSHIKRVKDIKICMNNKQSRIQLLLVDQGYGSCINNAFIHYIQSIDIVFSKFGSKVKNDIIARLRSTTDYTQNTKFPYHTLTKNIFSDLFGDDSSEIIVESIRKEMLRKMDFESNGTIEEILDEIQRRDISKYLKNVSGHEHVLFLWNDKNTRNKIMETFFAQPDVPQAIISSERIKLPAVENVLYSDLLSNKETAIQKELQMITQIHQKNQTILTTRLAGIDCTKWFKHGLSKEFLALEKQIDSYFEKENISCICGYNINEIPDSKTLKTLLKSHNYVMLDDPYSLFEKLS
jgi:hypothetical protein